MHEPRTLRAVIAAAGGLIALAAYFMLASRATPRAAGATPRPAAAGTFQVMRSARTGAASGRDLAPTEPSGPAAPVRWRSFRTVWRAPLATTYDSELSDIIPAGGRIYYGGRWDVGCLDAATGEARWHHWFAPEQSNPDFSGSDTDRSWRIAAAGGRVFGLEYRSTQQVPAPPPRPYRLQALEASRGRPLWERSFASEPVAPPCLAGKLVLVSLASGEIQALRASDGELAWRARLRSGRISQETGWWPAVQLRAEGGIAVAQISGRLRGFRVADGKRLWERVSAHREHDGPSLGFTLERGVAYALSDGDLVALEAATGRRIWWRPGNGGSVPSPAVAAVGPAVVCTHFQEPAAVRREDGRTLWWLTAPAGQDSGETSLLEAIDRLTAPAGGTLADSEGSLLLEADARPAIAPHEGRLAAVESTSTLVALDPASGAERWRWQPPDGYSFNVMATGGGERLYLRTHESITAVEPGPPDPLPSDPLQRRWLAAQMVQRLAAWDPVRDDPPRAALQAASRRLPALNRLQPLDDVRSVSDADAKGALLRIGRDAAPVLLEAAVDLLAEAETNRATSRSGWPEFDASSGLESCLDLLADLDPPRAIPSLTRELGRLQDPGSRRAVAEALLAMDAESARQALFSYSQSASNEVRTRMSALWYVCRTSGGPPNQESVTRYLTAQLGDRKAPRWLKLFARFELMNDRGTSAARAAGKLLPPPAPPALIPTGVSFHRAGRNGSDWSSDKPVTFRPFSTFRDGSGTHCAFFFDDWLGSYDDVWLAESRDGYRFARPIFVTSLSSPSSSYVDHDKVQGEHRSGVVTLGWSERDWRDPRAKVLRREMRLADLRRDTDGDGLTDPLERRIGTDPRRADTNGNGLPDGQDRNPLYRSHVAGDEEGIYQAVLEALCELSRGADLLGEPPRDATWTILDSVPPLFGSRRPLVVPLPPGMPAIEIREHGGVVLCRTARPDDYELPLGLIGRFEFLRPHIGNDGVWRGHRTENGLPDSDPFATDQPSPVPTFRFREFFPYELSRSGDRARIGLANDSGWNGSAEGWDVEVRKIGGRWVPVECRTVYSAYKGRAEAMPTPLRSWPGK